jgi:hypothetical protein
VRPSKARADRAREESFIFECEKEERVMKREVVAKGEVRECLLPFKCFIGTRNPSKTTVSC